METGLWNKGLKILLRPKRVMQKVLQLIAQSHLCHPKLRVIVQKARGVNFIDPHSVLIGADVYFDELKPENITVGKKVYLTEGVKILTHFYDTNYTHHKMKEGTVVIEDNVFIGFNVVISSSVRIGENAVIGANAVVTDNVKPNSVVGGIPAKIIGYRGDDK